MQRMKNIKILIGITYLIFVLILLFWFFSNFNIDEITSYKFIQSNRDYFVNLKNKNLIFISLIFILITSLWIFMLGFGSPVALLGGFIFGKWLGTLLVALGCTIGSTLLYLFGNYYLKYFIKKNFSEKYKNLEEKFKKNEFNYFLIYRLVGGIPFAIANLLPIIFNVSLKNYFFGTFLGILPSLFIITSLGHGFEKAIQQKNQSISFIELILLPEIYVPIIFFLLFMLISIIARKIFYKK
jgi:uncharacterized membrane protein YdjX (TVP38/TMEM64 family)